MSVWFAMFARAGAAIALVAAVATLPLALLLRAAHLLPVWIDGRFLTYLMQVVLLALALAVSRASFHRLSPEPITQPGLRAGAWLVLGTLMLSVLVTVTLVSSGPPSAADGSRYAEAVSRWVKGLPNTGLAGGVVLLAVLGPIFEELLFRGFILGFLLRRAAPWFALGLSTVLFAMVHDAWLFSALGGVAYGLLYLRFESVWLCSLVHGAHNLVSATGAPVVVAYLYDARLLLPIEGNLLPLQITWLVAACACFAMFLWEVLGGLDDGPLRFMLRSRPAIP